MAILIKTRTLWDRAASPAPVIGRGRFFFSRAVRLRALDPGPPSHGGHGSAAEHKNDERRKGEHQRVMNQNREGPEEGQGIAKVFDEPRKKCLASRSRR